MKKRDKPKGSFTPVEDPLGFFIAEAARQGLFSIPPDIMKPRPRIAPKRGAPFKPIPFPDEPKPNDRSTAIAS